MTTGAGLGAAGSSPSSPSGCVEAGADRAEFQVASHAVIASGDATVSSGTTASPEIPISQAAFVSAATVDRVGAARRGQQALRSLAL